MNTPSLRLRPLAAAILCSLLAPALFAQTATTTPVGFITVTVPAAIDANTPSSLAVSIPLYNTADYVSSVATLDSTTQFTLTGASWTPSAFATAAAPRFVRVKTSTTTAHIGKFFVVTANTANQLTVSLPPSISDIASFLSVGDTCEIVPANTFSSVFQTGAQVILATGATATDGDNVFIVSGNKWERYYHNGTIWKKAGNLANQDNTIIYPDEALFIVRTITSTVTLTFMGTVPSTSEQTDLGGYVASGSGTGPGTTFIANRFPTDTTLAVMNIQATPGWTTGATATDGDNLYIWNATATPSPKWETYYHNGTNWKKAGNLANQNSTIIPAGTGVVVVRSINTSPSSVTLTQAIPYVP